MIEKLIHTYHFIVIGRKIIRVTVRSHPILGVGVNGEETSETTAEGRAGVTNSSGLCLREGRWTWRWIIKYNV